MCARTLTSKLEIVELDEDETISLLDSVTRDPDQLMPGLTPFDLVAEGVDLVFKGEPGLLHLVAVREDDPDEACLDQLLEAKRRLKEADPDRLAPRAWLVARQMPAALEDLACRRGARTRVLLRPFVPTPVVEPVVSWAVPRDGLREESEIHAMGYRADGTLTTSERRTILANAVMRYGLANPARTISGNASLRRKQDFGEFTFQNALAIWDSDYQWLRETYYDGHEDEFADGTLPFQRDDGLFHLPQ